MQNSSDIYSRLFQNILCCFSLFVQRRSIGPGRFGPFLHNARHSFIYWCCRRIIQIYSFHRLFLHQILQKYNKKGKIINLMEAMAQNLKTRPPVIVVMGHIDHGKSTLLDYIRNTNTTDKEAGGITQHIAAYEVEIGKNHTRVTFLDTPGHEAFCAIPEPRSKVAEISILVVSAEDGVKPQTVEALECIKHDNLPFIV